MKKIIYSTLLLISVSFTSFAQNKKGDFNLSAGIGAPSHLEMEGITLNLGTVIGSALIGGEQKNLTSSKMGALTLSGKYSVLDRVRVGGDIVYEAFEGNSLGDYNGISILPRADYFWVNKEIFRFYSGIGLGVSFINGAGNTDYSQTKFAYNIAPIGIELGKKVAFYGELGIGYSGIISGGIRYKL